MRTLANVVIQNGGEGLILRQPYSLYEKGKSLSLLKMKVSYWQLLLLLSLSLCLTCDKDIIDAEALVVSIEGNKYICKL